VRRIDTLRIIRAFTYGQGLMAAYLIWAGGSVSAVAIGKVLLQLASFTALGHLVAERRLLKEALSGDDRARVALGGRNRHRETIAPDADFPATGDVSASQASSQTS
jgi:hypothetical protein